MFLLTARAENVMAASNGSLGNHCLVTHLCGLRQLSGPALRVMQTFQSCK